jgi:hypothetical protein
MCLPCLCFATAKNYSPERANHHPATWDLKKNRHLQSFHLTEQKRVAGLAEE